MGKMNPTLEILKLCFVKCLKDICLIIRLSQELFKTEMQNLELYGYGVKSFVLSMIETIGIVSNQTAQIDLVSKVIHLGRDLLQKPVELLDGVENILQQLHGSYKLVLATKGDLLDQERKLIKSGLEKYFHHIEIMSDKKETDYLKLIKHLDCLPEQFLMIGNSVKSDILPVLNIGGFAVHIPFHTTWEHEKSVVDFNHPNFLETH
jgi:putative hydrolase of the HAD superfamily